jgi:hypothetical protein
MIAALATLVLAQGPTAVPTAGVPAMRLHVGAQVGLPSIIGIGSTATLFVEGRPRFDVDLWWEPSGFLQSYSVGGAWHPFDRAFFVGPRLRLLHFHAPWSREFQPAFDTHLGLGLEGGARIRVGPADKGVISIGLHTTFIPTQSTNLRWLFGLSAGFSWSVWER